MSRVIATFAAVLLFAGPSVSAADASNGERGEEIFNSCESCHMVGHDAEILVGPPLNDVFGRPAGSVNDFGYSDLSRAAGAEGLVWTERTLVAYLEDPTEFLAGYLAEKGKEDLAKGRSKMSFRLHKTADAVNVIAYLKTISDQR